jgi:hypothetical protein
VRKKVYLVSRNSHNSIVPRIKLIKDLFGLDLRDAKKMATFPSVFNQVSIIELNNNNIQEDKTVKEWADIIQQWIDSSKYQDFGNDLKVVSLSKWEARQIKWLCNKEEEYENSNCNLHRQEIE